MAPNKMFIDWLISNIGDPHRSPGEVFFTPLHLHPFITFCGIFEKYCRSIHIHQNKKTKSAFHLAGLKANRMILWKRGEVVNLTQVERERAKLSSVQQRQCQFRILRNLWNNLINSATYGRNKAPQQYKIVLTLISVSVFITLHV